VKKKKRNSYPKIGPVKQKVLTLLCAGLALSLSRSPRGQWRIIKSARKEWDKINQRSLREAVRKLYQSKIVGYKENKDGTITLVLNEDGKKLALRYNLENIEIKKPARWDRLWRVVIFDIPESNKRGRDALAAKLKNLGFIAIQKSVFVYPHDCKKEVDFIVEIFDLRPFVRFIVAEEIDIDLDLKSRFGVE
jgi:DNA-binding transcriptional regulator PaaX